MPILVIVSGVPGTGKSTLTRYLRQVLGWPAFNLDPIKEILFDASTLPVTALTPPMSHQLGTMAEAAMVAMATEVIHAGRPCIVESFFRPEAAGALRHVVAVSNARQVHCVTPAAVSIARYRERFERGERHPVHLDGQEAAARSADPLPADALLPVPLGIPLLTVETEAGYLPSLEAIVRFCGLGGHGD